MQADMGNIVTATAEALRRDFECDVWTDQNRRENDVDAFGMVHGVWASDVFLMFLSASTIERLLGKTGITVVTRLLGMLLAALSVQFVLDGLGSFGLGS
jgi:small neutral amino acid transporter SnatA (MarC family)